MRDTTRLTRRGWIVGCAAGLSVSIAGCLGGDGSSPSEGSSSDGSGDGGDESGGSSDSGGGTGSSEEGGDVQIVGEQVVSEEITGGSHWDYDLAEGETMTVVMENDAQLQSMTGHIVKRDRVNEGRLASTSGPGREVFQYTAEETTTYRVNIGTGEGESMTVEIYIERN